MGTGSGILAMAAARLLHRPVLATDIEPWSVRVAATMQGSIDWVVGRGSVGWMAGGIDWFAPRTPYDLVFANILARPLCLMASGLAAHLAPGGTAVLSGLLQTPRRAAVEMAHRRRGLRLEGRVQEGPWTTLILRAAGRTQ